MCKNYKSFLFIILLVIFVIANSCKKIKEFDQDPEIEPLQHGFKTSVAIGYCASLASIAFSGGELPDNVLFQSGGGDQSSGTMVLLVEISNDYPLPFNNNVGEITIAGIGDENGGVISIIFSDINILSSTYEFYGIRTIPVIKMENGNILTLFAEQDIIIGEGSDTLLNLNLTSPQINLEQSRLDSEKPTDMFAAVKQNVWFVDVDQQNTVSDIYDDLFNINGGGQIVEITSSSGGVLYHAMIQTEFAYSTCSQNPVSGVAFIQNLKAGTDVDLGNIVLDFHEICDGRAYVEIASGKYIRSNGIHVNLNF